MPNLIECPKARQELEDIAVHIGQYRRSAARGSLAFNSGSGGARRRGRQINSRQDFYGNVRKTGQTRVVR
jgi:hypothetical protein